MASKTKAKISPKNSIHIKGARQHNLKNVEIEIPRGKFVVVTGVSGSGKSSLTIDTLYAEGQRRYVESLSAYARQFLMRMNKPDVDYIKGISPAIAIEQKVITRSSRSTVGTLTEIYDFLRLLYARIGKTISPVSGKEVKKHEVRDVVDYCQEQEEGTRIHVVTPLVVKEGNDLADELNLILQKGFSRLLINGKAERIEEVDAKKINLKKAFVLIDRLVIKNDEDSLMRLADSVQTAFFESGGECIIDIVGGKQKSFSNRFELDGMRFEEPSPQFFNFNSPFGACKKCEGFGQIIGIDANLVIPNKSLSLFEGAIAPWRGEKMSAWQKQFINVSHKFDFPVHTAIQDLSTEHYDLLWTGNQYVDGLDSFFEELKANLYKIQYRVMLSKYRGRTKCRDCKGTRLRKDSSYVKINSTSIRDLVDMPIQNLLKFFKVLKLNKYDKEVSKRILLELENRLNVMNEIGLGYLNLNRISATLSGGETQRINLTRSLGSNLTNSMYILDEPSIGLHSKDTERLIEVLQQLRNLGNTVIVVEHDEDVIRAADFLIDMGPKAGIHGGDVVFADSPKKLKGSKNSLTADYLTGTKEVAVPKKRRKIIRQLTVEGAQEHNLKNIDVQFPLHALTVVCGVSGSGKSTLVKNILYPALQRKLEGVGNAPGKHKTISGDLDQITKIEMIDQNPLGRSSRSNPVTYTKAYDPIRQLYASQQLSKINGFLPKHFSFNVEGGRCETCKGEGYVTVEMQFLADVNLLCEECNGQRFKPDVLDVKYKGKSIFDILELSIEEAILFFGEKSEVGKKIKPLEDVGLGYVKLGQASSTLSGGEAQRVKLASYLGKGRASQPILFIFDEPSTGLHFHDINKLLTAFNALIEQGHSIIVVEHQMDIIKSADWLIDLGPDGGENGGKLLYQGTPEGLLKCKGSYTAQYLKEKL